LLKRKNIFLLFLFTFHAVVEVVGNNFMIIPDILFSKICNAEMLIFAILPKELPSHLQKTEISFPSPLWRVNSAETATEKI